MSKKDNQSVIIEPNIFAAMNPGYGVSGMNGGNGNNVVSPTPVTNPSASSVAPALDPSSYTFTAEQLGLDTEPAKPVPAENAVTTTQNGSKLGDFFRGLAGKVKPWGGTDASKSDGGTIGYLGSLYTSPAEESEYRRRSQNKMKLLALADAVRQFGNIYHTTQYAPSQHFENIYDKERARYLQDKAVRDRDNQYYFQQKAREAQMEMQRERMAAEAAERAERISRERELHPFKVREYEGRAKAAESNAGIKALEYEYKPTEIEKKSKKADEETNLLIARKNKTYSDAANNTRRTNALNAKTYSSMNNGGGSGGGGGSRGSGKTSSGVSLPIRVAGRNGSYGRKTAISEKEMRDMYQDAVSEGYVDKKNQQMVASGQQTMEQVINKVATYTKKEVSDDFFRRHGLTKVIEERKPESKNTGKGGKRIVNMNAGQQAAVNKLQGKSV